MAKIVREYGRLSLEEYAGSFFSCETESIQSREDLIEVVGNYARRLLGGKTAGLLERHFSDTPVALTGNHHGVDYQSLAVQGTILFALPKITAAPAEPSAVVPVLACGTVPLSNSSFPRGILLSRKTKVPVAPAEEIRTFCKLPLIPVKYSNSLVSVTGPITEEMVSNAIKRAGRLFHDGELGESEKKSLLALLNEEYSRDDILKLAGYSDQVAVLNGRLWKRMFAPSLKEKIPELAYLEMEQIVTTLLGKDLRDEESLIHNLLFDPELRNAVLPSLDGQSGCWNLRKLERLSTCGPEYNLRSEDFRGCGTVFFWGVNARGERVPLLISENGSGPTLVGITSGRGIRVPLTPAALEEQLRERRLLPGLFTSFTTLAIARGLKCIGGFFQVDYLPAMQQGIVRALESRGLPGWAEKAGRVPTANFITGMNVALALYPDGTTEPAGAVEMIAAGGLTEEHLEKIKALTVHEATLSGMTNIRPNSFASAMGEGRRPDCPKGRVPREINNKMPRLEL